MFNKLFNKTDSYLDSIITLTDMYLISELMRIGLDYDLVLINNGVKTSFYRQVRNLFKEKNIDVDHYISENKEQELFHLIKENFNWETYVKSSHVKETIAETKNWLLSTS